MLLVSSREIEHDEPAKTGTQDDEDPELPFPKEWASLVRRARGTKKLSQKELADKVGVEQATISYIESHVMKSSTAVIAIARELGIPRPSQYFEDELEQRWVEVGQVLRKVNEAGFKGLLAAAEAMIVNSETKEH